MSVTFFRTAVFSLLFVPLTAEAQEESFQEMSLDERRDWIVAQAEEYELRWVDGGATLQRSSPVLRFNDNVTGVVDAIVFAWSRKGRPEAAASFWYRKDGLEAHEFVSLSRGEFEAIRGGDVVWAPAESGLEFTPLSDGPKPGQSSPIRLTQMRRIASKFSASVEMRAGDLNLRLMPQPLVRYEPEDGDLIDGAIFSFAKGTNPEVLLVIEARSDESGDRFFYAPARMTSRVCELRKEDAVIWNVPHDSGYDIQGSYRNLYKR